MITYPAGHSTSRCLLSAPQMFSVLASSLLLLLRSSSSDPNPISEENPNRIRKAWDFFHWRKWRRQRFWSAKKIFIPFPSLMIERVYFFSASIFLFPPFILHCLMNRGLLFCPHLHVWIQNYKTHNLFLGGKLLWCLVFVIVICWIQLHFVWWNWVFGILCFFWCLCRFYWIMVEI